jgi:hypothetical protein
MPAHPPSTVKVTNITPCGEAKVCITMEMVVDIHRLAEVGSQMLAAAAKQVSGRKKQTV